MRQISLAANQDLPSTTPQIIMAAPASTDINTPGTSSACGRGVDAPAVQESARCENLGSVPLWSLGVLWCVVVLVLVVVLVMVLVRVDIEVAWRYEVPSDGFERGNATSGRCHCHQSDCAGDGHARPRYATTCSARFDIRPSEMECRGGGRVRVQTTAAADQAGGRRSRKVRSSRHPTRCCDALYDRAGEGLL